MRYFFDASSIYTLVRAKRAELLIQNYTCNLARYELGNILLVERNIRKVLSESEQKSLLSAVMSSLGIMYNVDAVGMEQEIVDLAVEYGLSFYDASYVYLSKRNNAILVTEDQKLAKKVKTHISTITAEELF